MKDWLRAFQGREEVQRVLAQIRREMPSDGHLRIMHVCGSHEHTLIQWGLRALLPENLELIAGPGCPVCICPEHEVGEALEIARRGAILTTYGDMLRVPTRYGSLAQGKAEGLDIRIVYSATEALRLARENPRREVVLFAIGFETTAAPTAALLSAGNLPPNFSVLVAHRLTPPAMVALLESGEIRVDAFIAPGHVSTITGAEAWRIFAERYLRPTIVAGFEPLDMALAVLCILRQWRRGEARLENEYTRAVSAEGNRKAQEAMSRLFEVVPSWWRGIGLLPASGLALKEEHAPLDARRRFGVHLEPHPEDLPKGCACNRVMLGQIRPSQCPLYAKACTPATPRGPCMVSQEGTCFIWYRFGEA